MLHRARLRPGQQALDLKIPGAEEPGRSGVITGKRSAVLWHVLSSAYTRLGFDVVDDAAFQQLVLARIVEPTSKVDSLRQCVEPPNWKCPSSSPLATCRPGSWSGMDDARGDLGHADRHDGGQADRRVIRLHQDDRPGRDVGEI